MNNLFGHALLGASWEGYVLEQIIPALNDSVQAYFYRTADGSEVDLVLAQGIRPVAALEIKFSDAPSLSKGTFSAFDDLKTEHNFVVTPSAADFPMKENVWVCNVFSLLGHLGRLGLLDIHQSIRLHQHLRRNAPLFSQGILVLFFGFDYFQFKHIMGKNK